MSDTDTHVPLPDLNAADPAVVPPAAEPGGWDGLVYYRLHGSPKVYYSAYPDEHLEDLAKRLKQKHRRCSKYMQTLLKIGWPFLYYKA